MANRAWRTPLVLATAVALVGCYTGVDDEAAIAATDDGTPTTSGASADDDGDGPPGGGPAGTGGGPSGPDGGSSSGDPSAGDEASADGGGTDAAGSDDGSGSTGDAADTGTPPSDEVPGIPYCSGVAAWDASWSAREVEILEIVNQRRAAGADCHSEGVFGPAGPLTMNAELRCAARVHSEDMVVRDYFDHDDPDGNSPGDRIDATGYQWSTWGENIAAGNSTAAATMDQWMNSDGHCANIMNPAFEELGVGYYPGGEYGHYWTQAFGTPP